MQKKKKFIKTKLTEKIIAEIFRKNNQKINFTEIKKLATNSEIQRMVMEIVNQEYN